jgi:hypothetical protein
VYNKLFSLLIVGSGGLHLYRVVAVAQLSEAEAAHVREVVHLVHEGAVAVGVQGDQGAPEQVELNSELCGEGAIHIGEHLVGCQEVLGVVLEIID